MQKNWCNNSFGDAPSLLLYTILLYKKATKLHDGKVILQHNFRLPAKEIYHYCLIKFIAISVKELIDASTAAVVKAVFV